jgi:hypothetical protein
VDTSFHHAEAFGNKIRIAYASFWVIQEVLELSEGVWTLVDRTLLIFTPWQNTPLADTSNVFCKWVSSQTS